VHRLEPSSTVTRKSRAVRSAARFAHIKVKYPHPVG
jgi:hypothetical protein